MINQAIAAYTPIGLEALNDKAEMLERLDNKYILATDRVLPTLQALKGAFDILQIDDKRAFTYSTRYFDDEELRNYYDHLQRRRKRGKVRVREYVDSGLSFLEVKLKKQRASTAKHRLRVSEPLRRLDDPCRGFIDECYRGSYDQAFEKPLKPVILIGYQRITLVAKEGGERLTIDTGLNFRTPTIGRAAPPDMFIIETKSARGNGIADKILRSLHVPPTKLASKYCIGMAATGQVSRRNGFLPALRRLGLAEPIIPLPPQSSTPHRPFEDTDNGTPLQSFDPHRICAGDGVGVRIASAPANG